MSPNSKYQARPHPDPIPVLSPKAEQADQDRGDLQNDIASDKSPASPAPFSIRVNSD
jgi:hypothetical protein